MAKIRSLDCDAVVLDLEDAVAPSAKAEARRHLIEAFSAGAFGGRETVVRVNACDTTDFTSDMDAVAHCAPDAVLLPKVERKEAFDQLASACRERGIGARTHSWAMVETPAALFELDRLVQAGLACPQALSCLVVGTNDIVKDTGVSSVHGRAYLLPWLMNVVLVARRRGVAVLDGVWNDFGDTVGFDVEALQGRHMGFDGKTLIHPTQIEPANRAFAPDPDMLEQARLVVDAFAQQKNADAGVIQLGGKMVERLHLAQAQRMLELDATIRARRAIQGGRGEPAR
jgi:citrate lyase subunit beta/citryl-CoA lyase